MDAQSVTQSERCLVPNCKQEVAVVAHGIRNGDVYDEPHCEGHWNLKKLDQFKAEDKKRFKS